MKLHPVFNGVSEASRKRVEEALQPFECDAGATLFHAGDQPEGLYFIEEGSAAIHPVFVKSHPDVPVTLRRGAGSYLGEMSLLDRRKHYAEVTAESKMTGRLLPVASFDELSQTEPNFVLNLARFAISELQGNNSDLIHELARAKIAAEKFIDRLKAISQISQVLNSTLKLDQLLSLILREATTHSECEKGTIYLLDTERNELYSRVLQGSRIEEIRLPVGKGIAGFVAQTGQTVNIPNPYEDDRFNPEIDKQANQRTRNLLTMPMRTNKDTVVGVLQLMNKLNGPFNEVDEQFLSALSTHASIAIERAQVAEKMVRSEAMAAVGRFAAGIIHDIKNTMTIIDGYTQLLRKLYPDVKAEKYLNTIQDQVARLVAMSREVLEFSQGKLKMNFEETDLNELVWKVVEGQRTHFDRSSITVDIKTDIMTEPVMVDREKFSRVLLNLTGNAIDAMPDGGTLSFIPQVAEHGWALEVQDTGTGIPPDRLMTIFEPFVTYDKRNGTGLGLAISRQIVEHHHGDIVVDSEPGKGAVFRITIPYHPEKAGE